MNNYEILKQAIIDESLEEVKVAIKNLTTYSHHNTLECIELAKNNEKIIDFILLKMHFKPMILISWCISGPEEYESGRILLLKKLLDIGINIDDYKYMFCELAYFEKIEIATICIEASKEIKSDYSILMTPATNAEHIPLIKLLVEKGMDINFEDAYLVNHAALNANMQLLDYAIKSGADVTLRDDKALTVACLNNDENMIRKLVDNGASYKSKSYSALRIAANNGLKSALALFIEKSDDIEVIYQLIEIHGNDISKAWLKAKLLSDKLNSSLEENVSIHSKYTDNIKINNKPMKI